MADELVKVQLGGVFREPTFGARYHYLPRRIRVHWLGLTAQSTSHNISAALQKAFSTSHNINSALQENFTATNNVNSALQKAFNVTHSIDSDLTDGALETTFGRPIEDISAGAWLPSTGIDLYATIDEEVASDTDYNYTTSTSTFEVKLTALADPAKSTGHTIYFRVPAGFSPAGTLKVSLREGASTEIAVAHNGTVAADTTYNYSLSGAEADSITDYTDLRLRFEAI